MVAQINKTEIKANQTGSQQISAGKAKSTEPKPKTPTLVTPIQGQVQVFIAPHRNLYADIIAQGLRVAGQGMKVLLVQLFQTGINQGLSNPRRLVQNLEWLRCEAQRDLSQENIELTDAELSAVLELWHYAKASISEATADLVIIDEANLLIARSLVTEDELLQVLKTRSPKVNIILTGASMPSSISDYADQITHRRN
ncbi:P-loop NTPase family protein [Pseudanabaena biceps]|nr:P-loop NTPase family protein [Pseudanabaena biceps]